MIYLETKGLDVQKYDHIVERWEIVILRIVISNG